MAPQPRAFPSPRVRVFLSSAALLSLTSVWKAAALAIAELGIGAFFVVGPLRAAIGPAAPWFVLVACLFGAAARLLDTRSWALFLPGGLPGRVDRAFGPRAGLAASAIALTERAMLAALVCVVIGRYVAAALGGTLTDIRVVSRLTTEELASVAAIVVGGSIWIQSRRALGLSAGDAARGVWVGIGALAVTVVWASITAVRQHPDLSVLADSVVVLGQQGVWPYLLGFALALPVLGSGDALTRLAHEFPLPRDRMLRRTSLATFLFALAFIALPAFLFTILVPASELAIWDDAPLAGLAHHLAGPEWLGRLIGLWVAFTAILLLVPALHAALRDGASLLRRLASEGVFPADLALLDPRFGAPARALDVMAVAIAVIVLASGSQLLWLGSAYALSVACVFVLKLAVVIRLRAGARREGALIVVGAVVAVAALALVASGNVPALTSAGLVTVLAAVMLLTGRRRPPAPHDALDTFELLPSADLSRGEIDVRPGNLLVPVRNPYALGHLIAAMQAAGDRDIVVMTVRLLGGDTGDESSHQSEPTADERELFSRVAALAERQGRPVRLLIVPAQNVFDAVMSTVLRLRSAEIYVGESASLTAEDQARLTGDAWERADKPEGLAVRLVLVHSSGRLDAYHLGAHPPALQPGDLELIHRIWLDVTKAVGPHVHHDDVVRAALTQMEEQLSGPGRDDALATVRQVSRPSDELAGALHARDFARLRDITRNRHGHDLAALLTELSVEDQVLAFRLLPRKDASALFEYLSHEGQETLLKAMAQQDVAALLNDMAPDDRTMFLEELPASVTRQLLSLLTPTERSVAINLLGYPEGSVGRLMTPQYVVVPEDWTVRQVLDHIRAHGQDSETLNVIYVADEQGLLVDDIRIRELLLTSLDTRVTDLMDRRFVALKATDDQETAVAKFRSYDRTALPVTDTAGVLIGIVTIDDVLDVAEATATKEIQKIGGSEALDEPYMQIAFGRMIRKRAGWLTALFIGEMLTATAMSAFEAEISKAVVLALFVPLIISSGGNSGSQASTLVIRALALSEVRLGDWWRVIRREMLAGLALGAILGSIGFLRITIWSSFSSVYGEHWLLVAITVAMALVGIVLWGTLVGSLLPFVLRRLGFDPATSSAPFVATLVDVTGLVIYFSLALVILRGTLL